MMAFWRNWLTVWCGAVAVFGVVLTLGASPLTDAPVRALFGAMGPRRDMAMTDTLRFATALMGAVTLGWSLTTLAAIRAAIALGPDGRSLWVGIVASILVWFAVDSSLSVATGFSLNAASNSLFLVAFLLPVLRNGVLRVTSDTNRRKAA